MPSSKEAGERLVTQRQGSKISICIVASVSYIRLNGVSLVVDWGVI